MDKALIFGVFDFVSFHVCRNLLDKGIEVTGIPFIDDEDRFTEEKRFEVGRNANFNEQSFSSWAENGDLDGTNMTMILSFFDLYMEYKDTLLGNKTITAPILKYIQKNIDKCENICLFLPIKMLMRSSDTQDFFYIREILKQINQVTEKYQLYYLPTIYGEWQPPTYTFQQAILKKMNKDMEFRVSREGTNDAIYIEDVLEVLLEKMETKQSGAYFINSGQGQQWEKCAQFLGIEQKVDRQKEAMIQSDSNIVKVTVKEITSIPDSLNTQMEHIQRLYLKR